MKDDVWVKLYWSFWIVWKQYLFKWLWIKPLKNDLFCCIRLDFWYFSSRKNRIKIQTLFFILLFLKWRIVRLSKNNTTTQASHFSLNLKKNEKKNILCFFFFLMDWLECYYKYKVNIYFLYLIYLWFFLNDVRYTNFILWICSHIDRNMG